MTIETVTSDFAERLANVVEIHDDAGWSLSLCFGRGLEAGKRMHEFSDAYRAGDLVPRTTQQAEIAALRAERDALREDWTRQEEIACHLKQTELALRAEVARLREVLRDIAGNGDPDFPSYSQIVARAALSPKRDNGGDDA